MDQLVCFYDHSRKVQFCSDSEKSSKSTKELVKFFILFKKLGLFDGSNAGVTNLSCRRFAVYLFVFVSLWTCVHRDLGKQNVTQNLLFPIYEVACTTR
jgi:hypothetical protein